MSARIEFAYPGVLAELEAIFDWGDGTTSSVTVNATQEDFSADHTYDSGGVYPIMVTLNSARKPTCNCNNYSIDHRRGDQQRHPADCGNCGWRQCVRWRTVWGQDDCGRQLPVPGFWHYQKFDSANIQSVQVLLGDGNDHAVIGKRVYKTVQLDGGAGNDYLKGGRGDDILLGGDGRDLLVGSHGRDLLIGGLGADRIVGNADDDIIIGGRTAFDHDDLALAAIMAEWTSGRDYATRIENLRGTGTGPRSNESYYLIAQDSEELDPAATVFDDDARDVLTGGQGRDWFFANCFHDDEGRRDRITDLRASEFAEDLDWIEEEIEVDAPEE